MKADRHLTAEGLRAHLGKDRVGVRQAHAENWQNYRQAGQDRLQRECHPNAGPRSETTAEAAGDVAQSPMPKRKS